MAENSQALTSNKIAEHVAAPAAAIDDLIDRCMVSLADEIRHDQRVTGLKDQDALDRHPISSAWKRMTVEEILTREKAKWMDWRESTLAMVRRRLAGRWPD